MLKYPALYIIVSLFLISASSQPTASDSCIEWNDNYSVCTKCAPGLYLQYFFCIPCNPMCICSSDQDYCQACLNITVGTLTYTAYMSGDICILCYESISSCLSCNDNGTACFTCFNGTYVTPQGLCSNQTCDTNCEICHNQTSCSVCLPGYFLNKTSGLCSLTECTVNCTICEDDYTCKVCLPQSYVENGTCYPCMENCLVCTNNETCLDCIPSYLFYNGSCQNTGLSNCILYTGGFENPTCLVCQPGYYNAQGSCTQCSGCLLCTQAFLCQTQCLQGYTQFNYACIQFQQFLYFLPAIFIFLVSLL